MVIISPRFLKANATICGGRHLENVGELADRDELVDADQPLLALGVGDALRLDLLAVAAADVVGAAARGRAAHGGHGLRDVRVHGALVDGAAASLLAPSALGGAPLLRRLVVATRGRGDATAGGGRRDGARRHEPGARHRARARRARRDGPRPGTLARRRGPALGARRRAAGGLDRLVLVLDFGLDLGGFDGRRRCLFGGGFAIGFLLGGSRSGFRFGGGFGGGRGLRLGLLIFGLLQFGRGGRRGDVGRLAPAADGSGGSSRGGGLLGRGRLGLRRLGRLLGPAASLPSRAWPDSRSRRPPPNDDGARSPGLPSPRRARAFRAPTAHAGGPLGRR